MRLLRRMLRLLLVGRENGIRRRVARAAGFGAVRAGQQAGAGAPPPPPARPAGAAPVDSEGWTDVAARSELDAHPLMEVRVEGEPVVLALVEGTVHAHAGTCLHAGGPLADGTLEGSVLTCPYHGWSYDVTNGTCQLDPSLVLARYAVRESGGRIRIRPVSAAPRESGVPT